MTTVESRSVVDDEGDILLIPETVAFGEDCEVVILRVGEVLTIRPRQPLESLDVADRS